MVIPWPFSRVVVLGGTPIRIPEGLSPQQLGPYRELVQKAMDELQSRVERWVRGEAVELSSDPVGSRAPTPGDHSQPAQAA